jgi:hypothetical protein
MRPNMFVVQTPDKSGGLVNTALARGLLAAILKAKVVRER